MNDRVDAWIDRLMNKKMRDFDATHRGRFALDTKAMLPIPIRDFDVRRQHVLTVSRLVWIRKPHLLLIDEVGYEKLTPGQANLFFQVVNARYEQGSMIITTNKPFGKWAKIVSDEAAASATLDRLLHHAHIL